MCQLLTQTDNVTTSSEEMIGLLVFIVSTSFTCKCNLAQPQPDPDFTVCVIAIQKKHFWELGTSLGLMTLRKVRVIFQFVKSLYGVILHLLSTQDIACTPVSYTHLTLPTNREV